MSTFDLDRLATVQLVPVTPFTPDGRQVAGQALTRLVRDLHAAGIRVFIPAAGTGEFHSLSVAEVIECTRMTREAAGPRATIIAPVGFSIEHALAIGRGAAEAGADALLIMPPVHPYLSDAGFGDYVEALAGALPLPLLAYKKGPVPSDRLLAELGRHGSLLGVKYAVNDLDAFPRFATAAAGYLGLYCGTAERFAPFFMLAGATGYTSGCGNICPRLTLSMFRALAAADYAQAMQILNVLRPIEDFRARDGDSYNISLLKFALALEGRDVGPPRPPNRRLTPDEEHETRAMLAPILAAEANLARVSRDAKL